MNNLKTKASSTLNGMKKSELIEYIRILEHNYNVAVSFNEQQAKNLAVLQISDGDCVSRKTLMAAFEKLSKDSGVPLESNAFDLAYMLVEDAFPVVPEVKRGEWMPFHSQAAGDIQYCSCCEVGCPHDTNYCPNCGAKMGEGGESE